DAAVRPDESDVGHDADLGAALRAAADRAHSLHHRCRRGTGRPTATLADERAAACARVAVAAALSLQHAQHDQLSGAHRTEQRCGDDDRRPERRAALHARSRRTAARHAGRGECDAAALPRDPAGPFLRPALHRHRCLPRGAASDGADLHPAAAGGERDSPRHRPQRGSRHDPRARLPSRCPSADRDLQQRRAAGGACGRHRTAQHTRASAPVVRQRSEIRTARGTRRRPRLDHAAAAGGIVKALIVDDEPLARHSIRLLLERDGEVEIAGECSGADAAALIARTRPDILFLDIQMPEVGGFELLEEIGLGAVPVVIFVTAYDHYAIQAFDAHGLDYLLKPFDDDRFLHALERAKTQLRTRGSATFAQRFLVRVRDRFVVVNTSEIDWIEAADYYVTLHAGGKSHLLRETMAAIETR